MPIPCWLDKRPGSWTCRHRTRRQGGSPRLRPAAGSGACCQSMASGWHQKRVVRSAGRLHEPPDGMSLSFRSFASFWRALKVANVTVTGLLPPSVQRLFFARLSALFASVVPSPSEPHASSMACLCDPENTEAHVGAGNGSATAASGAPRRSARMHRTSRPMGWNAALYVRRVMFVIQGEWVRGGRDARQNFILHGDRS